MMRNNVYLGSAFALTSALFYSAQTAFIKYSMIHIALPVLVFMQSFICLLLVTVFLLFKKKRKMATNIFKSEIKQKHLVRTIFSLGISYFLFASLRSIPFFDSIVLYNTFPLFIPFIAWIMLRNKINHSLWIFIIAGFIGVLLTFNPDEKIISPAAIFALLSGVSAASSIVMMREISKTDNSLKSLYFYFLFSTIISGFVSIPFWEVSYIHLYLPLMFIGALFFFVQLFLTLATTYTTPQVVSSLYYSNILFSFVIASLLFNEKMSAMILAGSLLIIIGGIGVITRQRRPALQV